MRRARNVFTRTGNMFLGRIKTATPLLTTLAVVFLLIGIWWLGPTWNWHDHHPLADLGMRVAATFAVLLVPTALWATTIWRRNRQFEAEHARAQAHAADQCLSYLQAQDRALDQQLADLRRHASGDRALYRLPWYLVLGQENAGKTSFVNRSNQNFALTSTLKAGARTNARDESLAYHIDWWIGDDAVLIDPPGELISQPDIHREWPAEHTSSALEEGPLDPALSVAPGGFPPGMHAKLWDGMLHWLARHRSRRPLNGVVLMVDLTALLSQAPSDRGGLARLLRARLDELTRHLGTRLPLYVVLTKVDLLDGFEECFARLPRAVREDLLGFTFTLDTVTDFDAWQAELASGYNTMVQALNARVLDALGEAQSTEQRESLFSLVHQLAGIRPVLFDFLGDILGSSRHNAPALVRGVYFSSVYQQGLVANAFVAAASRSYGIRGAVTVAKRDARSVVFFAQRLFQEVIYPEAGLAGDNVQVLARKRRLLMANTAVAALGCLLVLGGWHYHFTINRAKAESVLAKSRAFSAHDIDTRLDPTGRNLIGPLDQIRDAVGVYGDYRAAWPGVADMGLYLGRAIGPTVDAAYVRLLSQRFLPALASGVMDAMNAAAPGSNAQLAALRVYRMIEDRQNRRPDIVTQWMVGQWQRAYATEGGIQAALKRHLVYAMNYADATLPDDRARVAEVQAVLREIPLQQRVYMTMKHDAYDQFSAPLDPRRVVGPAFDVVYTPAVPQAGSAAPGGAIAGGVSATVIDGLLTARGFQGYFQPRSADMTELAMIDEWVLGERRKLDYSPEDKEALAERIRSLYTADYIDSWQRALNQATVGPFTDIAHAVQVLETATGPAAPLRRMLEAVRDNTVIDTVLPVAASVGQKAVAVPLAATASQAQSLRIRRAFSSLVDLLEVGSDKPSYFDETMASVGALYGYMKAVQDSPDRGKAALKAALDRFALVGPDPIAHVRRMATGLPEPLNGQVQALANQSLKVLMIEALRELETRWDADVYTFYHQRLAGRYPFNAASRVDASLEDFEGFFGPQGLLAQFHDQYLKVFLRENLDALYSEDRGAYLVRADVITQLEAADRIRNAFFNNRGALNVQFTVEPLGLTPNRRSSVLNVDGQLISYSHGPSIGVGLMWPNTLGQAGGSKVTLISHAGAHNSLAYPGPWSLFRLIRQGRVAGSTPTSVDVSFQAGEGAMRYRLTAEKANNPFTQQSFKDFQLPRTLLQNID